MENTKEFKKNESYCDAAIDEIEDELISEIENECDDNIYCECCDSLIENDDYYNVKTEYGLQIYCRDCFDKKCFHCPDCEENYLNETYHIEYQGHYICNSCSDNYNYCEQCDEYVHYNDYNSDHDCCCECDEKNDTGVESYHESSYWDFVGECKACWKDKWRGIGIELEIDRDERDIDAERDTVSEIRDIYNNLKFEYDGSLENGFEIITHPHTVDAFYSIDWGAILKACKQNGYNSHSAIHCGLHVHFSRTMFGLNERRQANSISKLINFFEMYWDDIIKVSRRTEQQANDYAGRYGVTDINDVKRLAKNKNCGRYFAVNNTNRDTVEIRIMRGTLNLQSFLACIDFCIKIVKNCRYITWKDIADTAKWLKGMKPETLDYIRSRDAFREVVLKCA